MKEVLKKVVGIVAAAAICTPCVPVLAYDNGEVYVNDTFADETSASWQTATTDPSVTTNAEVKDGVLHYTSDSVKDGIFFEPGVVFTLNGGNGIEYKEGKKIEVQFKIRKEDTSVTHVKIDLPSSQPWGNANGYRGLHDIMKIETDGTIYVKNGNGMGTSSYTKVVSGANGKDVEVFAYLDGTNKTADFVISVDKKNYSVKDCDWSNPSEGSPGSKVNDTVMKNIAIVSDNVTTANLETADVYIDNIDIREVLDGTFADNFDNNTSESWIKAPADNSVNNAFLGFEADSGMLHYKAAAIENNGGALPGVIRAVNGLDGISYSEGEKLVLKFRVKKAPGANLYVKAGYPTASVLAEEGNGWRGRKALIKITDDDLGLMNSTADGYTASQGTASKITQDMTNKWIDTVVVLDGNNSVADYFFTIDGKTYSFKGLKWSSAGYTYDNSKSLKSVNALTSIAFVSMANPVKEGSQVTGYKTDAEVWIDNVSVSKTDGTFVDDFDSGVNYDGWVTTKSSSAETTVEMIGGKIHYTSNNTTSVGLDDSAGIVRMINGSAGVAYDANLRYELKFKINKESEGAEVHVKTDYSAFSGAGEMASQGWRGELDLMVVQDNAIMIKDGNGYFEEHGETQETTSFSKYKTVYSGSTVGKDIDVTVILDGLNRKANYKIVMDGKTYTINNCDWSDAKKAWTKHTEKLTSLAFMSRAVNDATVADVSISNVSLKRIAAVESKLTLMKNYSPIEGSNVLEAGDSVSVYYKFQGGVEGYGDYSLILVGYTVDENGVKQADNIKIMPIYAGQLEIIEDLGSESITVPSGGKYEVKAFLWETGTQNPASDAVSAAVFE